MSLSLAENVIVVRADNHPPMLDKTNYSSWASRILLYIKGKEHGKLLVDSILNRPFQYETIVEPWNENTPATVKARTYTNLTDEEKICESFDIKETNIIWDRVKLFIQGSKLSLQERESKLYDDFDIFTSSPGESIHSYYMRFAQLINDMHTIGMTMQPLQVNIKFVNRLQPEQGKFVTDIKLAKDMHTTNFDHLYAYLRQHEAHANQVHLTRQRYPDQIALVANSPSCLNPTQYYPQLSSATQQYYLPLEPQRSYDAPMVQQSSYQPQVPLQPSSLELDSGLVVPSFNPSNDPIANLNKIMTFVSTTFALHFLQTNNQMRTSSNPRNQATTQDGRVIVQTIQGRQTQGYANNGEIPSPAAFQIDNLDAFDFDCDDAPSAKTVLIANLSSYDSDVLLEVQQENLIINETLIAELERYKEQVKIFEQRQKFDLNDGEKYINGQLRRVIFDRNAKVATFEKQIHSLKLQLNATVESHKILSTTNECLNKESKDKEDKYLDEVIDLQKKNKALDNVVYKIGQSMQTMHILTKPQAFYDESHKTALCYQNSFYLSQARRKVPALYYGDTIVKKHDALFVPDTEETLDLAEESRLKMLAKQNDPRLKDKKVDFTPVNYVALNKISEHFVKHFVPLKQLSAEQAFWLPISQPVSEKPSVSSKPVLKKEIPHELPSISLVKDRAFKKDVKPFAQTLKEYFHMFEHGLYKELKDMKDIFNQIEIKVDKCFIDKKYFEIEKKELSLDNDRLLEHTICQDVMTTVMHADDHSDNLLHENYSSLEHDNSESKLLKHENDCLIKLLISQDLVHTAVNSLVSINDYKTMQQSFIDEYNETLVLKAKLAKKHDMIEKAVYNELLKRCSRLENRSQLKAKNLFIEKLKEHIMNIKGKNVVESVQNVHNSNVVTSKGELRPLDSDLVSACKFVTRIQELLVYVSATCPSSKPVSDKLVAVTPINRTRKFRFAESRVSSSTKASESKPRSNTKKDRIFWKPIGHIFTIDGNTCPLTRIISTNVVPHRKSISITPVKQTQPSSNKYGKLKDIKNVGSSSKSKTIGRTNRTLIAKIIGYGNYQLRNVTILRVYYVEGLGHNLFSVGQFCDSDLQVAFWKHTCCVWNLNGADLLSGSRDINLYTISLDDMLKSSPICLQSKASKTKSWLWHRRLSHLNFGTLSEQAKQGLVRGLPKLKFEKDHLCSTCCLRKSKKNSHKPKADNTNQEKLYLLHMDLCGPMRVESINRKKYNLHIQVRLNATVRNVRTDNGTEFVNQTLKYYYGNLTTMASEQFSSRHAPQLMTLGTLNLRLVPNPPSSIPYVPPTKNDWDILFQPMFDEFFNPLPSVVSQVPTTVARRPADPTGSPVSTSLE
ncbi:retrovirus-related pol polyprotein from transposon TNT 1-94 [Tanacetum coccineum]